MRKRGIDDERVEAVERLHAEIDATAGRVAAHHGARLRCGRGCTACCVDELTVFEVEAAVIGRRASDVLRERPHAPGACAFLSDTGSCRIYAHRPYVCRTQGLPLRWQEPGANGDTVELRDLCALNEPGGPPIETLPIDACWTIGPIEARLSALQAEVARRSGDPPATLRRVALRDLFVGRGESPRRWHRARTRGA